jgi:hypothetical protein
VKVSPARSIAERKVHCLELLGDFTQLAVGFLQLSTTRYDFTPQRLAFACQCSIGVRQLGNVFDAVDDEQHPSIRTEYWRIYGRPVPFLKATTLTKRPPDIVFLHRHRVRSTTG